MSNLLYKAYQVYQVLPSLCRLLKASAREALASTARTYSGRLLYGNSGRYRGRLMDDIQTA